MWLSVSRGLAAGVVAAGVMAAAPAAMASTHWVRPASTCQTAKLGYALGAVRGTPDQRIQEVALINQTWSTCTLAGFPGVELVGTVHGKRDYGWNLRWESAKPQRVTLKPGKAAHFDITYLPAQRGDGTDIGVTKILITPPDDYHHAGLWWHQSVLLQDGATYPGTYVGPVMPGR